MAVEPLYSTTKCVICAADLDPRARKCIKCNAYQDGVECTACGLTMPGRARQCPSCKAVREGKPCRSCGEIINEGSKRCSFCGLWQSRRRFLPASEMTLALILSLVSVLGATIVPVFNYFGNRSNTYISVIGDYRYLAPNTSLPEDTIRILITNTGKRQSVITSASISFDKEVFADQTRLTVMNSDQIVIKPGEQNYLCLSAPTVARLDGKKKKEVLDEAKKSKRYATIDIAVAETNWKDDFVRTGNDAHRTDRIETALIYQWMEKHVSSAN